MGVDKKDIKTVLHISAPATAEAYIQEAGRGGRDGSIAKAILIWSLEDSFEYATFKSGSREAAMRDFAETKDCRRQVLLDALGAEKTVCSGCDLCNEREKTVKTATFKSIGLRKEQIDWKLAFNLVRKNRNFFCKEELELELTERMNRLFVKSIGKQVWNHSDSAEVVRQLELSGKIFLQKKLWKGAYRAKSVH